jgi:hypothetical protein
MVDTGSYYYFPINEMTSKAALVALDQDPLKVSETGVWVKVDADNGVVGVTKK